MFVSRPAVTTRLAKYQSFFLVLILVIVFASLSPRFVTISNSLNVLTAASVIGLIAVGATFVIGSGGIDLSAGSVMALSGTVTALLLQSYDLSPLAAITISLCTGAASGFVTGLLINATGAPNFIITLGMLSIARAIAYVIADASPIYGLPDSVTTLGQDRFAGIPGPVIFLLLGTLAAFYILHHTRFGRHVLMFGDNSAATAAMGINSNRLRLGVFTLAGCYSGLAGFVLMARTNSGEPAGGQNYELIAITAVILGGANLFGGRAAILGTVAGVLCLGVLQNGLNLLAVSTYYQVLFVGAVLIIAAFISRLGREVS